MPLNRTYLVMRGCQVGRASLDSRYGDWDHLVMTEEEARKRCADLAASSPERDSHSWLPKKSADGRWTVVKVALPAGSTPLTVKTISPKDQAAKDDPRSSLEQRFPPHSAGF